MVLVEHLARARVAHQEALELLRKHVARAHRPVRLRRDLVCVVAGRRYAPKDHVGHGRDLVVVVEHDALVPGDAEVLEQHVAGKDACAGELLDRVAVVAQRPAQPRPVAVAAQLLDMQVERPHAPLDVDMPDHQLVAVELELRADLALQLVDQRRLEALERQRDERVLERVGHAPDPIVQLDQQVLVLHRLAVDVLRRREPVADHLEHVRERGQREHQHHQPLDAGGDDEAVARVPEVVVEVAVKEGLALLGESDRHVDLGARLLRHQPAQERHVGRGHFHVDEEVGAREREQHQELAFPDQQRVQVQLAALVLQNRHGERQLALPVDDPADDVGRLVAEEERPQHLDLQVRADADRAREMRPQRARYG